MAYICECWVRLRSSSICSPSWMRPYSARHKRYIFRCNPATETSPIQYRSPSRNRVITFILKIYELDIDIIEFLATMANYFIKKLSILDCDWKYPVEFQSCRRKQNRWPYSATYVSHLNFIVTVKMITWTPNLSQHISDPRHYFDVHTRIGNRVEDSQI